MKEDIEGLKKVSREEYERIPEYLKPLVEVEYENTEEEMNETAREIFNAVQDRFMDKVFEDFDIKVEGGKEMYVSEPDRGRNLLEEECPCSSQDILKCARSKEGRGNCPCFCHPLDFIDFEGVFRSHDFNKGEEVERKKIEVCGLVMKGKYLEAVFLLHQLAGGEGEAGWSMEGEGEEKEYVDKYEPGGENDEYVFGFNSDGTKGS